MSYLNAFKEGFNYALMTSIAGLGCASLVIVGLAFGAALQILSGKSYHITCYSPDLAITYMSIEPVTLPNEYGVWKFASGKGAYIQQSGDTCITQEVVEIPEQKM